MSAPRSIHEVSAPYANFMLNPAPAAAGVCSTCWTFHDPGFDECYRCGHQPNDADVVVPITYSVGNGQMHHSLRHYKDGATRRIRDRFTLELAAVLWRFLLGHEYCVATAANAREFSLLTVVPSATTQRDDSRWRLRYLVGEVVDHTAERFEGVLRPTDSGTPGHQYDPSRYQARRPLDGDDVLLIDDTWTTGGSVQAAAYALKRAGARTVGVVVMGRHINREYGDNDERLRQLPPFRWDSCAVHDQAPLGTGGPETPARLLRCALRVNGETRVTAGVSRNGRGWFRTSDLSRVKRALSH
jgi:hypothetical protein